MRSIRFLLCIPLLLLSIPCPAQRITVVQVAHVNRDREAVRKDYAETYAPAAAVPHGWSHKGGCDPGTVAPASVAARLAEINYFRRLAGLSPVAFDPELSKKAQAAAFVMRQNSALSHHPSKDWKCWSELAAAGAGSSNLHLGWGGPESYMFDFGEDNGSCGHRMWVLSSQLKTMGWGATDNSHALTVFGESGTPDSRPPYVAWPPAGYMPVELMNYRWTFSLTARNADYSAAKVKMSMDGKPVAISATQPTGYGDGGFAWEIADWSAFSRNYLDKKVKVQVEGVRVGDEIGTYTYEVVPFRAQENNAIVTADTYQDAWGGSTSESDASEAEAVAEAEEVLPYAEQAFADAAQLLAPELPAMAFDVLKPQVARDLVFDEAFAKFARKIAAIRKEKNPSTDQLNTWAETKIRAFLAHRAGLDSEQAATAVAPKFIIVEVKKAVPLNGSKTMADVARAIAAEVMEDGYLKSFALKYRGSRQCGIGFVAKRILKNGQAYAGIYATVVLSPKALRLGA